ncbi:MAG TPA: aldehyde dehydrogenase family protein, partial [Gemmatimonadales bacterium]
MTTKKMERETSVIRAPSDGSEVGVCHLANPEDVRAALDANERVSDAARKIPSHERAAALRKIADGMQGIRPELARTLALEAGKSINQARLEIDRTIDVFRDGAEEATRITGEVLTADGVPTGNGKIAITRRFPLSPIAAITPFNYPLLLAAHKVAPAMACGATVTLKPPPQDPLTTLRMFDIIKDSGYPEGAVNVVPCHVEVAQVMIEDPRV